MIDFKRFLAEVTHQPGVYQMLGKDGSVIYVGKARDLKKRLSSYFSNSQKDAKTQALVSHIHNIDITVTHNEAEALILEWNLINQHRPHYNVLFRDDKSYPYIHITNDEYPQIEFYRGSRKRDGLYFGPFPSSTAVRETVHLIEKIFKIRNCTNGFFNARTRPCMQYQIDRCTAPCVDYITPEDYQNNVRHAVLFLQGKNTQVIAELVKQMEKASKAQQYELAVMFRDQITKLREIQSKQYVITGHGNADVIGFALSAGLACIQLITIRGGHMLGSRSYFPNIPGECTQEEIVTSFITQHYLNPQWSASDIPKELILNIKLNDTTILANVLSKRADRKIVFACNVRGERKKWLEIANNSAQQSVSTQLMNKANTHQRFRALQEVLALPKPAKRIECFDISHTMGEATVGSCVVFNKDGPMKSDYRRFNISGITPGDDFAAMQQAIQRRYKRLQSDEVRLPEVLLIDGGIPQLHAAEKALAALEIDSIYLVGVAKGSTRKPGFETLHFTDGRAVHLAPDSMALHLIQQIRDEAHRFAIAGHRMRRDKKRVTSVLEDIPGVGAKKRRDLLRYFGGIQAINRASLEELTKVPGISLALAQRIFAALHNITV